MSIHPWFKRESQQLTQRFLNRSLHHGLLFSGSPGIGKRVLAESLMATILCHSPTEQGSCGRCQSCKLVAANTHPDHYTLESEKQLGVDAIRTAISKLSTTAQIGQSKVLLIPRADTMTESASNALLKTLEEPTNNTFLLLLTHRLSSLLATILSRCEKHAFAAPNTAQSLQWLSSQGVTQVDRDMLNAYGGAPLRVMAAVEDESALQFHQCMQDIEDLLANKRDIVKTVSKWKDHAEQIIFWLQQHFNAKYTRSLSHEDYANYQQCISCVRRVRHPGVNKTLLLTQLFNGFGINR